MCKKDSKHIQHVRLYKALKIRGFTIKSRSVRQVFTDIKLLEKYEIAKGH